MFEKKINNIFFQVEKYAVNLIFTKPLLITLFILLMLSSTLKAHEMWIEPVNYSLKLGDKILANEIVGQNFKGNKYAYLDSTFEALNITVGDNTQALKSRLGDIPAIQYVSDKEGLHIITAQTTTYDLVYDTAEKFAQFLNEDGLEWVFEKHKKRGLPEKGFIELYSRSPKALVKIGHGKGEDKAVGLPLEWVVETNPYVTKGNIKARLLWQGKPAVNMHVNVFNKPTHHSASSDVLKTSLRTDKTGRVEIPRANGGLFLINSVKMIEPDADTAVRTKAVWESIWGSLSYEILPNT